ncbi:TerD family protein [Streptomyces sp. WI03-4A]|uniref:TerD family protein n=1 Tax=Streptomyces sp. WI03-4A TaxID=3028706 RepID=UPI0029BA183B|nr:TerD family protein [Streptomyces sp. WI03-4A]MDX2597754.1 TerD family protein [Streptomyces sp. WI03-4A]
MTAELVRGQNHPLSQARVEIRVSAGVPVLAGAALCDEQGTVRGAQWVAHPGAPTLPGIEVPGQAAADHRLAVDLAALPEAVHRVSVLLALPTQPGGALRFGAVAAPRTAVTAPDGTEIARFILTGLDAESAVVALELYRRNDAWKVRAVGQGYARGLPALLADQGLSGAEKLAAAIQEAVAASLARAVPAPRSQDAPGDTARQQAASSDAQRPEDARTAGGPIDYSHPRRRAATAPSASSETPVTDGQPAPPVAGDATGWSMEERLYNQVWGMFEDLARTTAAYRSAVDFADSRLEKELDQALADPRNRLGGTGEAAREAAQARHTQLADQARAAFDRDLAQLTAESEVVEPALPPAFARWDNPVWHGYRVPAEPPMALRLGDLCLPESASLRIPLLARLPLERGLWIDSGPLEGPDGTFHDSASARRLAMESAVALAARLLAVHPAGEFAVQVVDPAGAGAEALLPLSRTGAVAAAPASGAAGVAEVLERLTRRVDLTQMAMRGGAAEALPPDVDAAQQLLIVNDFPHGFDERAVTRLRYLADEGPAVGVHLLMVADREDAEAYGPLLDPLWRSLMRLTPVPDDHLADPWVGHAWTYEPCLVPPGSGVLEQVLTELTEARTKRK